MKTTKILMGVALVAGIALSSCMGKGNQSNVRLTNEIDSVSYALGLDAGLGYADASKNLQQKDVDLNMDAIREGFLKGLAQDSVNYKFNSEELTPFIRSFFMRLDEKERESANLKNIRFLHENRQKEGVKVTESGLQYRIITEGKGKAPAREDVVRVHYEGRLVDGTVFDSSLERGEPTEFPVGAVIQGWSEALMMMPVGSKWELVIPSEIGYGERPVGPIPANSVLVFEVELLDIVNPNQK